MKFVVPIYKAIHWMSNSESQRIYAKHKNFYHPMARDAIERAIEIKSKEEAPFARFSPGVWQ